MFIKDRVSLKSVMSLYSNYLKNPQNIDIDWITEFDLEIFKGLKFGWISTIFYDDDILTQITNLSMPNGVETNPDGSPKLGKRVSFTNQLLIKYAKAF